MSSSITSSEAARSPARRYVIATVAIALAWLAATMAANILIDPQGVFGTRLVTRHFNPNARYGALRDYAAAPERYDAVLFASSRGNAFDRALLARRLGVRAVANFSVPFGLLTDHLPALEFLLRDKAARGGRLAAVFLVLDADFFGKTPWTNVNLDSFLPPQISGESAFRFWWRYLTAFQLRYWESDLGALARVEPTAGPPPPEVRRRLAAAAIVPLRLAGAAAAQPMPIAETFPQEIDAPEIRSNLAHQLELLARLVALCRAQDVRLLIAFSPLNGHRVSADQAADNARIVDEVARITPVWDFNPPASLSDRPDLWQDFSHYSPALADVMLRRIFGPEPPGAAASGTDASGAGSSGAAPPAPADFGRLRAP
jgi:hypothetical protein